MDRTDHSSTADTFGSVDTRLRDDMPKREPRFRRAKALRRRWQPASHRGAFPVGSVGQARLDAALWQYSERVATLVETTLDEYVRQL